MNGLGLGFPSAVIMQANPRAHSYHGAVVTEDEAYDLPPIAPKALSPFLHRDDLDHIPFSLHHSISLESIGSTGSYWSPDSEAESSNMSSSQSVNSLVNRNSTLSLISNASSQGDLNWLAPFIDTEITPANEPKAFPRTHSFAIGLDLAQSTSMQPSTSQMSISSNTSSIMDRAYPIRRVNHFAKPEIKKGGTRKTSIRPQIGGVAVCARTSSLPKAATKKEDDLDAIFEYYEQSSTSDSDSDKASRHIHFDLDSDSSSCSSSRSSAHEAIRDILHQAEVDEANRQNRMRSAGKPRPTATLPLPATARQSKRVSSWTPPPLPVNPHQPTTGGIRNVAKWLGNMKKTFSHNALSDFEMVRGRSSDSAATIDLERGN